MLNFIKKAMILNLLAVSLGGVSQASTVNWDWLMCVKKDGSSIHAKWKYYSPTDGMVLLNANSKTAHKSVGNYTWLSIKEPSKEAISYLTDGNQPISLPGILAEAGCKELIKTCQSPDPAYEYVATGNGNPIVILRSDGGDDVRKKITVCPYLRNQ